MNHLLLFVILYAVGILWTHQAIHFKGLKGEVFCVEWENRKWFAFIWPAYLTVKVFTLFRILLRVS